MKALKAVLGWVAGKIDARDLAGLVGVVLLVWGGERLYPGAGMAAAGAALLSIAALVR